MEELVKVMNLGTYDVLHYGHLSLLKFCKQLAGDDEVIIGLNTAKFVKMFKGQKPVMSFEERKKTLLALPFVDRVVENKQPKKNAGVVMLENDARIIVSGMDWLEKDLLKLWGIKSDWLNKHGIGVCFYPFYETKKMSSSLIKERIRKLAL